MTTKTTPTLRRIKRRPLYKSRAPLPSPGGPSARLTARPPTPIPGYRSQNATVASDVETGIHSDSEEVEPSSSRFFRVDDAETPEAAFSSLLRLIDLLGEVYRKNDSAAFWNLARFFATTANDIASYFTESKYVDSTRENFYLAKGLVRLLLDAFESTRQKIGRYKSHSDRNEQLEMRSALEYAEMIHESLLMLYRTGLRKPYRNKPLPPLPLSQVPQRRGTSHLSAAHTNIAVNRSDKLIHVQKKSQHRKENDSIRPVVQRRSSLPCLRVDNYNQRHTLLFFGEAKIPSTFSHVDQGSENPKLNKGNRVKAVSVSSLISIITSGEGTTDLGVIQATLSSFRLFITPTEFFQGLKDRFEIRPPTSLDNASEWDTKISNIRVNVLAVIRSWLDQYWQADDAVALDKMRAFVEKQSESDSNENLSTLLAKIKAREGCSKEDLLDERRTCIASTSPARTPPPDYTKFKFPQQFHASSDGLLQLNTDDGREELSRHLTMKMSRLYRQLDPSKVVEFWYKQGDSCRKYDKFKDVPGVKELATISAHGEQLSLWIISSILEITNIQGRRDRISLWVDVASRSMAHCDYATAHNIYASLSFSSIIRLKKTILTIPYATKLQYEKLKSFFNNEGMFKATFNDLRPSLPSTAPLIRHIVHVKSRVEKDRTSSQKLTTDPSSPPFKPKFICFDECRVTQQATRVLNKALLEYKFHENKNLSQWLDDRLKEFCAIDMESVYKKLHEMSKDRESTSNNLRHLNNPWKYCSSNPSNPLKGTLVRLSFEVQKSMEQRKKASFALFTILKPLAFG